MAVRKRSDVLRRSKRIAVRSKATRKKATRKKKCVAGVDTTSQLEAFELLQERLNALYAKADERAGAANDAIHDLLNGLERKLTSAIDEVTDQLVDDIENLAVDVDARVEELEYRARKEANG